MTIRVLELAKKLKIGSDDLLAICVLLDIPATSSISCLTSLQAKVVSDYEKKNSE